MMLYSRGMIINNSQQFLIMQNKVKQKTHKQNTSSIRMYFYTNSIFMGITKTLQRIGSGLILFHDGTCAVVSYNTNSQFDGKSIFYRNRCLISVNFTRNRIEDVAYRIDGYLLFLKYNEQAKLHGDGYLVSFLDRTIHLLKYEQGYIRQKIKMLSIQKMPVQSVFLHEAFHLLIGKSHSSSIRYEATSDIQNVRIKKIGNKVQVNYMENSQERLSQGLGFEFIYRAPENGGYDPETNRFKDDFELKMVEKGLYVNNMLDGYGLRIFKNNNVYEGYFQQNVFDGEGCLRNLQKGTWVYGVFENGEMKDILDFSNEGTEMSRCSALLENLREGETNFISSMIEENNFDFLDAELQRICGMGNIEEMRSETFQDKKLQLMRRITAQFTQLEGFNKNSLQQDITKAKNSRLLYKTITTHNNEKDTPNKNNGSQTDRKQKNHTIKSLMPQSIKATNYFNISRNNQKDLANIEEDKQKFQKIRKLSQSIKDPQQKFSKIFHKLYNYLEKEQSENSPLKQQQNSSKKRLRKSQIFTPETNFQTKLSLSPLKLTGKQSPDNIYRGRSPDRKTTIFSSTVKLKKFANTSPKNNENNDEQFNSGKLRRKSSIEKKFKMKQKKANNSPIFEEQKQKIVDDSGKFIYTYEQNQNNEEGFRNEPSLVDNRYAKLQPPSLLLKSPASLKK